MPSPPVSPPPPPPTLPPGPPPDFPPIVYPPVPTVPPPPPDNPAVPYIVRPGYPFKGDAKSTLVADDGTRIDYWVQWDGYSEVWNSGQGGALSANVAVNWDDASNFIKYAIGFTDVIGTAPNKTLRRQRPLACPPAPMLYCEGVMSAQYGGTKGPVAAFDNWFRCDWVEFRLTFRARKDKLLSDAQAAANTNLLEASRYTVRSMRANPREQKLPNTSVVFDDGVNTPVQTVGFLPDFEAEYAYQWLQIPEGGYPSGAIQVLLGCCNKTAFLGFPAETLLFKSLASPVDPYPHPDGLRYVDLGYVFGYRPNGWNKQRKADRSWVLTKMAGVTTPVAPPAAPGAPAETAPATARPYQAADLSYLFKPAQV